MSTIRALLLGVVIGLMISVMLGLFLIRKPFSQNSVSQVPIITAKTQESAIEQAVNMANAEQEVKKTADDLGISCGIFVSISVEQCAKFVARVESDLALKNVILKAKAKGIHVWPGKEFETKSDLVTVKQDASTIEIIKFLLG